ncbi:UDP-3-O-(3-hydroxymyristoyl)glucosamine N-acyltransferase [Desulforhopalus sp. IMCC35007]|uniref:UDP-3-O-(3-hydroxymyristoyl)glucosamine N-acyltransferase n=1 Tax=Desulforhopalus sp. IMCC35007 TaxID=2569543 RepID=UPI0010AEB49D|nr:UDP-3-O-(3-hydroxymyristoyl)glucosamine N-acyltransferase [Desulforhopalus sp. IMCC35007]TKB09411.1 UDP-3-O-(3-hydroxymyristoyl)glucosamine N-acyltransferase [Desulforhopalus sp. IMCC35007]
MQGKNISVAKLAELVQGQVTGDKNIVITGFAPLESAGADDVSFLAQKKNFQQLHETGAGAVLVPPGVTEECGAVLVQVKDPYLAAAIIHNYFLKKPFVAKGVHGRSVVGDGCRLGSEITIGPLAVLGDRVVLGERVCIEPGAVIGDDVIIGDDSRICANVTLYHGTVIGQRVTIHSGTVIGSDGYGYAANEKGEHVKRPQVGIVRIEDDVEIGSNSCVDRAAYGETLIKSGCKIDNLVQVGHNVVIGENSLIVAQVGISGSTTLGRNVVMGGQAATTGHITVGDQVMIAARGAAHTNLEKGSVVAGTPAIPIRQWAKSCAVFNKLPELQKRVKANSKAIESMGSSKETDK